MPNPILPTIVSPRARVIQRLLWTSLALTILTFAMSMVFFGYVSLFLGLAGSGSCLVYDITLLSLSAKERRLAAQGSAADLGTAGGMPTVYPPSPTSQSPRGPLPCTLRKPTIIVAFSLTVVWLASAIVIMVSLTFWDSWEGGALIAVPILEAIFTILHIGVLGVYGVQTWKERRRWIAGGGQLKWYQLGEYVQ